MNEKLFITRKRKKYKFAKFAEFDNCFQLDEWKQNELSKKLDLSKKITLELGAGTGLLSVEIARRCPKDIIIAIDIKSDRLYTGARLAYEIGLENIIFIRSDITKLNEIILKSSVDKIWITFPDPYAREDQTKLTSTGDRKRLTAPRYLEIYKQVLKKDGILYFKTDNKPLFDWSIKQLNNSNWTINTKTSNLHKSDFDDMSKITTTYEKRFINNNLPIYYLSATIDK